MACCQNRASFKQAGTKASTKVITLIIGLLCVLQHKSNNISTIMIITLYASIIEQNILHFIIYSHLVCDNISSFFE